MIPPLEQLQPEILHPQLNLAFQCESDLKNTITKTCLIDTGFDLALALDLDTYLQLGSPELSGEDFEINTANNHALQVAIVKLDVLIGSYTFPLEAILLDKEERPIIGTMLLQEICRASNKALKIDFNREVVSFT